MVNTDTKFKVTWRQHASVPLSPSYIALLVLNLEKYRQSWRKLYLKAWEIECVSGVFAFTLHAKSMWLFTNSRWGRNRKTVSALPKSIAKAWPEADLYIFTKFLIARFFKSLLLKTELLCDRLRNGYDFLNKKFAILKTFLLEQFGTGVSVENFGLKWLRNWK